MPDQPLPDAYAPNPNPMRWQLMWWRRVIAPPIVTVPMVVAGSILFLLIVFLIIHATTVPVIHLDSASSLSLLHKEVNKKTAIHGDFIFRIKNPSPFVRIKLKHMHVKLDIYYNHQSLMSTNVTIDSFVVGRLKKVSFTSSTNYTTATLELPRIGKSVVIVDVELEAKRRLGIIGDWWIFAFTLYASCDDVVFEKSSDSGKWTPLGDNVFSIDSFFDYV